MMFLLPYIGAAAGAAGAASYNLDVPVLGLPAYAAAKVLNQRYDFTGITPEQAAREIELATGKVPLYGGTIIGNVPARAYTAARNLGEAKLKIAIVYALAARYLKAPQMVNAARNSLNVTAADMAERDPRAIGQAYQVAIQSVTLAGAYGPGGPGDKQVKALLAIRRENRKAQSIAAVQSNQLDPVTAAYRADDELKETISKLNPVPDWLNPFSNKPDPKKRQRELILWSVGVGSVVALTLITAAVLKKD